MIVDRVAQFPAQAYPQTFYQESAPSQRKQYTQVEFIAPKHKVEETHEAKMIRELQSQLA